jgi:hypothetical protein
MDRDGGRDGLLFGREPRFAGLPREAFAVFEIADHAERRRRISEVFHPALGRLGQDLLEQLGPRTRLKLHAHVPRLDWPRDYKPHCTWLALSGEPHGYQAGPQLNVGVHADHVAVRLGWDTKAAAFGRFEFLGRHGAVAEELLALAAAEALQFRVYAAEAWPRGSRRVFESSDDLAGSFVEAGRRGVWWELGRRWDLPAAFDAVGSPQFGREAARIFSHLLPLYERIEA